MGLKSITEKRFKFLQKMWCEKVGLGSDDEIDWSSFSRFLVVDICPTVIASTWASYKHSFEHYCPDVEAILRVRDGVPCLRSDVESRTTRKRMKKLTVSDLVLLSGESERATRGPSSKYGKASILWLKAGILTGLRPHEWFFCGLIEHKLSGQFALEVSNRKLNLTSGKEWEPRIVLLGHLSKSELRDVALWLKHIENIDYLDGYESLYLGCKQWLNRANRRLWPRRKQHICLLSARHQFIANLKASGMAPVEIAYIVGHANDVRAYNSYGKTSDGSVTSVPLMPVDADLSQINEKLHKVARYEKSTSTQNRAHTCHS